MSDLPPIFTMAPALAEALTALTGDTWAAEVTRGEFSCDPGRATLTRERDGFALYVSPGTYGADLGKASVGVRWPADGTRRMNGRDWGAITYGVSEPSAKVAMSRPATALAADINRRVVEPMAAPWVKLRERQATQAAARLALGNDVETIRTAIGGSARVDGSEDSKTIHLYEGRVTADFKLYAGSSVSVELRYLTPAQAVAVAKALRATIAEGVPTA